MIPYLPCEICEKDPTVLYIIENELWNKVVSKPEMYICIECFKKLLKRDITLEDFDLKILGNQWIELYPEILNELNQGMNITQIYLEVLNEKQI